MFAQENRLPLPQPSPLAPKTRIPGFSATIAAGGAGAAALLVAPAFGAGDVTWSWVAAAVVLTVTALCARTLRRWVEPVTAVAAAPPASGALAGGSVLIDALPDPMLVVAAHEPDDITGRRVTFANAAARELLRIQRPDGLLLTVVR